MRYSEDEYLMLSGIQHFCFCRRQWALIHLEQQWAENIRTVDGEISIKMPMTRNDMKQEEIKSLSGECQCPLQRWAFPENVMS